MHLLFYQAGETQGSKARAESRLPEGSIHPNRECPDPICNYSTFSNYKAYAHVSSVNGCFYGRIGLSSSELLLTAVPKGPSTSIVYTFGAQIPAK